MTKEDVQAILNKIADELAGYEPQMETFKGITTKNACNITIKMAVALIRERAAQLCYCDLAGQLVIGPCEVCQDVKS